jgi:hypothetical protein
LEYKLKKESGKSGKQRSPVAPLVRGAMNSKGKGELAELAFVHKAASLGFGVAKPHGDNERYDFILDSGERLWRVQVKSTCCLHRGRYRARCHRTNQIGYKANEIDFVVAVVVPLDIWYVIPVKCVVGTKYVALYPLGCKQGGYFECYREAWHLMAGTASSACPPVRPVSG